MSPFHLAVVLLSPPKDGYPLILDKDLAGLTVLERLLLTLQRAGANEILILHQELDDTKINPLINGFGQDPRFQCKMHWQDRKTFSEKGNPNAGDLTQSQPFLLTNGNLVTHANLIESFANSAIAENPNLNTARSLHKISGSPGGLHLLPHEKFSTVERYASGESIEEKTQRTTISDPDFFWMEIDTHSTLQKAEEKLLKSCGLNNDSFMDRLLTRFFSRQLTGIFLKTSITPNQITFVSLLTGLAAALCFFPGGYQMGIAGAMLLIISAWIDCTDGEVARLKFMVSEWGARLDIIADNIVHCFVFFSIGMGLFYSTEQTIFIYLGLLAVLGTLASFILISKTIIEGKAESDISPHCENKNFTDQLANRDFIYFLFILALFGRLDAFILLTAVGSNFFAIYLVYQKFRAIPSGSIAK